MDESTGRLERCVVAQSVVRCRHFQFPGNFLGLLLGLRIKLVHCRVSMGERYFLFVLCSCISHLLCYH